jgi:hypothetical protein
MPSTIDPFHDLRLFLSPFCQQLRDSGEGLLIDQGQVRGATLDPPMNIPHALFILRCMRGIP